VTETAAEADRETLARMIQSLLGARTPEDARALEEGIGAQLARATPEQFHEFQQRIETTGSTWGYHPPVPLACGMSHEILRVLLASGSGLHGGENLDAVRSEPLLLLGNHLSFADANLLEYLLSEGGYPEVARRITVLVGPKVYTRPLRRFASLCFGTLKLPQSPSRASEEAVMSSREVARLAAEAIATARTRHAAGDVLLIFIEGTRSRTQTMQRALSAVARYLEPPARWVVPFGIWGTEQLVPFGEERLHPARVEARVGAAVSTEKLFELCEGKRPLVMDTVGSLIAELLPASYRGLYGDPPEEDGVLYRAREIARTLGSGVISLSPSS
jgi:1-acyl-sn-glycerol-3-phosphate acyltransferase